MSNTPSLSRRRFLGSIAAGAATAGASACPEKAVAGGLQAAPERAATACDCQNLGLISAHLRDLSEEANAERHFALRDELRAYGLGASEIKGRYGFGSPCARTVEVRGWYITGNTEDSGNLKGHLRKVGRKYQQQAVLVKGYYRDAVLHALTDLPALGLTDKETKELGPFRHACLGAYYTLLTTAAANAPPVPFCDLEPDMRRIDWFGGQWEEIGLWHPRTFFNGSVWTTFDEHGNAVVTRGRAVRVVSGIGESGYGEGR